MKSILLLLILITIDLFSSPCPTELARTSVVQNDYRESSISSVANLYNNNSKAGIFYNGNGQDTLFTMGFARGIWAAAFDPSGNLKVCISTYDGEYSDYSSGPVDLSLGSWEEWEKRCLFFTRAWKVTKLQINALRIALAEGNLTIDKIPEDILSWPAKGNPYITVLEIDEEMAPFHDSDGNGSYDPMMGDYPIALKENPEFIPHQFRFYVINDSGEHFESKLAPLNIEFHILDYVISCSEKTESERAVFTRLTYINRDIGDFRDLKIAIWDDVDLGCLSNDYTGCSTELNCSYFYNSSSLDITNCVGTVPVPSTISAVRSLIFLDNKMQSFNNSQNAGSTTPNIPAEQFYINILNGLWQNGMPITRGGDGYNWGSTDTTKFAFPDFPNDSSGWSMESVKLSSGERRNVTTVVDTNLIVGGRGTINFIDHVLIDYENRGLDVFNIYEEKINEVKQEYLDMTTGDFACGNNIMATEESSEADGNINIYPNPSSGLINISFTEEVSGRLSIYSLEGSKISEQLVELTELVSIDVADYAAGFYLAAFSNSKGGITSSYFMKE